MAKAQGVTEELNASDPMKWVGLMNNLQQRGGGNGAGGADLQLNTPQDSGDIQRPSQESQQMSLFDFAAFNQPAQAEGTAQPSIFPHPALPQQVIDEALCIGANDQNSRLIICAYFKKDKTDNARFLAEHYGENGRGLLSGWPPVRHLVQRRGNPHCPG